ncbi:MAG: hypothetical protein F9K22_09220 [Bacteroidetes bacterium]|nr:MAG: hypothetical protein F9K22_09220 [Bacteroidota bacterium]
MTPRERVLAAMRREPVDTVPLMCQMSIGHMLQQYRCSPADFWHDVDTFADGLVRLRELYGFDGILVSLHGHDPSWRGGIASRRMTEEYEEIVWKNGDATHYLFDDLPEHIAARPRELPPVGEVSRNDLPAALDVIPVSQGLKFFIHPAHRFDIFRTLHDRTGGMYSLHGEITSPFDYYLDFVGYQEGLIGMIDAPETVAMIMGHYAELIEELAVAMCGEGIDAIKVSSPYAGSSFISPEFYAAFVLPHEGRIARAVRAQGTEIYTHTCGAVNDRLELMFDAGVSGIECLDPEPLGDVDLADAFRRIGHRGFIKGNIDSVTVLLQGTETEIEADVRRRIETGRAHPGFILSTACSIAPRVKREHVRLLRTLVDRYGGT